MELRAFAERVLFSESIEEKLAAPDSPLTDDQPGEALAVTAPTRPANLQFAPRRTAPKMPGPNQLVHENKRGLAHHIMANHELQALEIMAWVLVTFPDAPTAFRQEMLPIMRDEQRHTRMHIERASRLGVPFGSRAVNCYIWKKAIKFTSILDYLAGLSLTFEGRNLDHTLEFEEYFRDAGDERSAAMMRQIHNDEIEHVAFGLKWLRLLKPENQSDWEAWKDHLEWPLRPAKAKGDRFHVEPRLAAGMTEDFIAQLAECVDETRTPE